MLVGEWERRKLESDLRNGVRVLMQENELIISVPLCINEKK